MWEKIAYFRNGHLTNVIPRNRLVPLCEDRQVAYDPDTVIVSDRDIYDPAKPETFAALQIPTFEPHDDGVCLDLSYILRMRCMAMDNPAYGRLFVEKTLEIRIVYGRIKKAPSGERSKARTAVARIADLRS